MHYDAYAFAIDPTIITIDFPRNETIGQRVSMSDVNIINVLKEGVMKLIIQCGDTIHIGITVYLNVAI